MTKISRVFVAGTMQGATDGIAIVDQSYRATIASIVAAVVPGAECFDPSVEVTQRLSDPETIELIGAVVQSGRSALAMAALPQPLADLRVTFQRMTAQAARCDLCVAFLPGATPSMGTAMEMYAAFCGQVPIVTITAMRTNLAIVSVSTWMLSDLEAFERWLRLYVSGQKMERKCESL